jgi:hypothetical protein
MEQITFEQVSHELTSQLEEVLGRLSVQAESGLSTYSTEDKAKKLAAKMKEIAFLSSVQVCKQSKEACEVYNIDGDKYIEFQDGLFIKLVDLPDAGEMPRFVVKIEGNTIMSVRQDLFNKLPSNAKKLLGNKEEEN